MVGGRRRHDQLNQPIVEVETAKAAVEIPAKWAGRVTKIYRAEGEVVEVGAPIIAIDTDPSADGAIGRIAGRRTNRLRRRARSSPADRWARSGRAYRGAGRLRPAYDGG